MTNNIQPTVEGLSFPFEWPTTASVDVSLLITMLKQLTNERVALLPFGAITKALLEELSSPQHSSSTQQHLLFFDRQAQPACNVAASSDITKDSADIFWVLSHSFDTEMIKMLEEKGIEQSKIFSIRAFPELLQRHYWQPPEISSLVALIPEFDGVTILLTDCADSLLAERFTDAGLTIDIVMDMQTSGVHRDNTVTIPRSFPSVTQLPQHCRIIAACLPHHYSTIFQHLKSIGSTASLILPFAAQDLRFYSPSPTPTIFLSFPHAGHGRFAPVLTSVAAQLGRKQQPWLMLSKNHRFAEIHANAKPMQLQQLSERDLSSQIIQMEWFGYAITHDIYDITQLSEQEWDALKIVQLIRDPRDVLTSVVMRLAPDDFESTCLRFMKGDFYFKTASNLLYWPSINDICQRFAFGKAHEQVFTVRFEDLHHQPEQTYRAMNAWLEWDDMQQPQLSDTELRAAIKLGSFEHQTQNKLTRGEESNILIGSCRKGITGDWKNHWTPALVEAFKQLCHAEFMKLGYETNEHWTL